jgi:hypothetical protein
VLGECVRQRMSNECCMYVDYASMLHWCSVGVAFFNIADPNSFIQSRYFSRSFFPADDFTVWNTVSKSASVTGTLNSALFIWRISSGVLPATMRSEAEHRRVVAHDGDVHPRVSLRQFDYVLPLVSLPCVLSHEHPLRVESEHLQSPLDVRQVDVYALLEAAEEGRVDDEIGDIMRQGAELDDLRLKEGLTLFVRVHRLNVDDVELSLAENATFNQLQLFSPRLRHSI